MLSGAPVYPGDVTLDGVMGGLCPAGSELTLPHVRLVNFGVHGDMLCKGKAGGRITEFIFCCQTHLGEEESKSKTEPHPLPAVLM